MDAFTAGLSWLYVSANLARVVSYLPQMVAIWRCRDGARAISLATWCYWAFSHMTAVLYGALTLHDLGFTSVSAMNLLCCGTVIVLTGHRRGYFARACTIAPCTCPPTSNPTIPRSPRS